MTNNKMAYKIRQILESERFLGKIGNAVALDKSTV